MATPTVSTYRPRPARAGDDRFVGLAEEIGRACAPRAAEHDQENTFVTENYDLMREKGYLRLAVPEELGGLGASMRQVCYAQAELAKHCASTALAVGMHQYLTMANAYRWRRGVTAAEGTLRRIASEGIVLMTSGASDGIRPSAKAVRDGDGYRVTGTKGFCSQAPVADVLVTVASYDDPQDGQSVLMLSIPTSADGVAVVETWDTMGMRATGSHDVRLEAVRVSDGQVVGRRPWGKVDPVLRTAIVHFSPQATATYYGIAAGAFEEALRVVARRTGSDGQSLAHDPSIQRLVGLMSTKLHTAWWALLGALDELGDDYVPDERAVDLVQIAKRSAIGEAIEVVDTAMEVVGGSSYFRRSPLERAYRDIRAGRFHPFGVEKGLSHTGRLLLGLPVDNIW